MEWLWVCSFSTPVLSIAWGTNPCFGGLCKLGMSSAGSWTFTVRGGVENSMAQCHQHGALYVSVMGVDQSLCDVFFHCDAYKKHKEEVWRRWKIWPTSPFIRPFIVFIEITSHPCLSVCPCVFLWIRCSPTLTFCFTHAERICLKESQAEGNLYLAGRLDVLFASVWEWINFALGPCSPCSALVVKAICKTLCPGGFQEKQSWEMDLACPSTALLLAGKQFWVQAGEREAVFRAASVQYRHPSSRPATWIWVWN